MIIHWQHLVVLGHHVGRQPVNIQLPPAIDGVQLLWNNRKLNVSVDDQY